MKKLLKIGLIFVFIVLISGCKRAIDEENMTIYTSAYPIEYVTQRLYGNRGNIKSIYPNSSDINTYKLSDNLINEYSNSDLFIFNGMSIEQEYIKPMLKENSDLKIIDISSDFKYQYGQEELWLDPSNLINIANNIKKGFIEYMSYKYLTDEIENNYKELKIDLSNVEISYRNSIKNADNNNIVVTDDTLLFLKKYGANVISLDKDNEEYENNIYAVKQLINQGLLKYVYVKDNEELTDEVSKFLTRYNIQTLKLYSINTLTDEQEGNCDYLSLILENLDLLKKQLYNS